MPSLEQECLPLNNSETPQQQQQPDHRHLKGHYFCHANSEASARSKIKQEYIMAERGYRMQRKWEIFSGKNTFFLNGRIVMARQAGIFYLTVFLIVGTSALFFGFDAPFLYHNVSPAIPVIGAILFIFTLSNLFKTSFSDPGIIPRATVAEALDTEQQIAVQQNGEGTAYRPPPRNREILVRNQTVKLRYCFTCKIFRPPRASHCSICDNCVERFDHHCPWVGNCVGRRNYRYFYMFLLSLAALCVFIFASAVTHLVLLGKEDAEASLGGAIRKSPSSIVCVVICFFSVWSIIGLAGFHTYLASSNLTTNEDIKGSYSSKRSHDNFNPFSRGGIFANCLDVLCSPLQPSLIDARGVVTEEYLAANTHPQQSFEATNGGCAQQPTQLSYGSVVNPATGLPHSTHNQHHAQSNGHRGSGGHAQMASAAVVNELQSELTSRNVNRHNHASVMSPDVDCPSVDPGQANGNGSIELEANTMIGSALDLDSLSGQEDDAGSSTVASGSQIGLIGQQRGYAMGQV